MRLAGRLFHRRLRPIGHRFTYPLWMSSCDLFQGNPDAEGFRRTRHLTDTDEPIIDKLKVLLADRPYSQFDEAVLLAQPSVMGIGFNPLSVYYVSTAGMSNALVLEVRNTPWREREVYILDMNGQRELRHEWNKTFHVSPFNPGGQSYQIRATWPQDHRYALDLSLKDHSGVIFRAGFRMQLSSETLKDRAGAAVMPLVTVGGIYWQALKLWLKGLPYQPYPEELKKG